MHAVSDIAVQASRNWPAMHVGVEQALQEPVCAMVASDHVPTRQAAHAASVVAVQATVDWPAMHVGVEQALHEPPLPNVPSEQTQVLV